MPRARATDATATDVAEAPAALSSATNVAREGILRAIAAPTVANAASVIVAGAAIAAEIVVAIEAATAAATGVVTVAAIVVVTATVAAIAAAIAVVTATVAVIAAATRVETATITRTETVSDVRIEIAATKRSVTAKGTFLSLIAHIDHLFTSENFLIWVSYPHPNTKKFWK